MNKNQKVEKKGFFPQASGGNLVSNTPTYCNADNGCKQEMNFVEVGRCNKYTDGIVPYKTYYCRNCGNKLIVLLIWEDANEE